MTETHDYSEFTEPPKAGDNSMARLSGLARDQKAAEAKVARIQQELAEAQADLDKIAQKDLPELMQELRLKTFTTEDGVQIEVKESIHASIPKIKADDAFKWLEDHNDAGMIKRTVTVAFPRDEEKWAKKFLADMAKRKRPLDAKVERKVEPATLKAWATKKLEAGVDIPQDLFGIHRRKITQVEIKT